MAEKKAKKPEALEKTPAPVKKEEVEAPSRIRAIGAWVRGTVSPDKKG